MKKIYVQQYGHFWRITHSNAITLLQTIASGSGYNLDKLGKHLSGKPKSIQGGISDGYVVFGTSCADVYLLNTLDMEEDEAKNILKYDFNVEGGVK